METIVTKIMEAVKGYDKEVEERLNKIKANFQAEEKRLNNVIDKLTNQLKIKYSNDDFILINKVSFNEIMDFVTTLKCSASNLEDEIAEFKYTGINYAVEKADECSSYAADVRNDADVISDMLNDLLTPEQKLEK